jgi:molybdopterin-containing oxidoreductase family membrane subunit
VLAPLLFLSYRVRTNLKALFTISILVNIGMWLERVFIVVGSTSHDFLPHNWGQYAPTWVEISITVGSFAWFFFWFLLFTKLFPTVSISDVKEDLVRDERPSHDHQNVEPQSPGRGGTWNVWAIYERPELLLRALEKVTEAECGRVEVYSPRRLHETEALLGRHTSPVRFWTLAGALAGLAGGFALAIGSALVNQLIVGGKPPVSILP